MPPRTADDFDEWFRRAGGDPWGYDSPYVQDRLDNSLGFISRHVTFVELCAFRGDFTRRLAAAYPQATIIANEISPLALASAREKLAPFSNVRFSCTDMAAFTLPRDSPPPVKLLALECIYYLPQQERIPILTRLVELLAGPDIFVSCPITGDPYPTQDELISMILPLGYRYVAAHPLTYSSVADSGSTGDVTKLGRHRIARQTIYRFVWSACLPPIHAHIR